MSRSSSAPIEVTLRWRPNRSRIRCPAGLQVGGICGLTKGRHRLQRQLRRDHRPLRHLHDGGRHRRFDALRADCRRLRQLCRGHGFGICRRIGRRHRRSGGTSDRGSAVSEQGRREVRRRKPQSTHCRGRDYRQRFLPRAMPSGPLPWSRCRNEGDVSCGYAANTYNSARGIHVGGLCGFIAGNETVNAVVRFSSNTGAVHSESGRIGGIMALASFCDVQECVNEGTVDGSAAVAGGISGLFEAGDMYDCVNVGDAPQRKRQCRRYRGYDADPKTVYSHHRLPQRRRDLRPLRLHGIDIGRESQRHRQGGRLRCRRRRRYAVAGA